ncbi:hypothetical protein [Spirosoma rhododendri]|uniref:Uncharacterized protein n=1 Tax=Spirosoma rhododendri TaxID=2728024 RepID=A0A7L5DLL5_9BACT|nr:hypothetical protein [Spirosoma rhododendri]QJD78995.1 hypothetical protein HH216_11580 [Spirosoma rhododendri]
MNSENQDAMLSQQNQTYQPETGGPAQTPVDGQMMDETYNPTDLSGDAQTMPTTPTDEEEMADGSGAASGSPNMEPDIDNYGNGDSLGNNDGTEPDPAADDDDMRGGL